MPAFCAGACRRECAQVEARERVGESEGPEALDAAWEPIERPAA